MEQTALWRLWGSAAWQPDRFLSFWRRFGSSQLNALTLRKSCAYLQVFWIHPELSPVGRPVQGEALGPSREVSEAGRVQLVQGRGYLAAVPSGKLVNAESTPRECCSAYSWLCRRCTHRSLYGGRRISRWDRAGRVSGWTDSGKQLSMGMYCIDVLILPLHEGSCCL
jgi:hypothetical protein